MTPEIPPPTAPASAPVPPHAVDTSYGEGAIQILEGLEAVRKRPGMRSEERRVGKEC